MTGYIEVFVFCYFLLIIFHVLISNELLSKNHLTSFVIFAKIFKKEHE